MVKIAKLLFLVILLAGCSQSDNDISSQKITKDHYTLERATNGIYVYTDQPESIDIRTYMQTTNNNT